MSLVNLYNRFKDEYWKEQNTPQWHGLSFEQWCRKHKSKEMEIKLTTEEWENAFNAWCLAIKEKNRLSKSLQDMSYLDLARQYGARVATKEHLDIVAECFNFEELEKYQGK